MELRRASLLARIGAYFFDYTLFLILGFFIAYAVLGHLPMPGEEETAISIVIPYFILFFCRDTIKGISPGRWAAGIMVRDNDDPLHVPSFPKLLLRNVMLAVWPVELLSVFFIDNFRRLGDKAANSAVLVNPHKAKAGWRLAAVIMLVMAFLGFIFYVAVANIRSSGAYSEAVRYVYANAEVKEKTGGIKGFGQVPAGNVSASDDEGDAHLILHVLGEKQDATTDIILEMHHGKWEVRSCAVY